MKKILIVGYGSHTKRKIIPSLLEINSDKELYITSRKDNIEDNSELNLKFLNLNEIIENKINFDSIIISSYPSTHIDNLFQLLENSNNFLIEKPITSDLDFLLGNEFKRIYDQKNIFECLMYFHHPLYKEFIKIINNNNVKEINSEFMIPHLPIENFRYKKKLGGGSTYDQGVYPISLIQNSCNLAFEKLDFELFKNNDHEVDLGGKINCYDVSGYKINIRWGMGFEYSNFAEIVTDNETYNFPMIYSKPDDYVPYYTISKEGAEEEVTLDESNQFKIMYKNLIFNEGEKIDYSSYENIKTRYNLIRTILND